MSIRKAVITAGLAISLAATVSSATYLSSAYRAAQQHRVLRNNVVDSVEAAMPRVRQEMERITGMDGSLSVGYFADSTDDIARARAPGQTFQGSDSMYVNTNTPASVFRMDNYTWHRKIWRSMNDVEDPDHSVLGALHHEVSHVRFGQITDSLSEHHGPTRIYRDLHGTRVLNEGAALWVEEQAGEMHPPTIQRPLDSLRAKLKDTDDDISYHMVAPVLDSLGYKQGVETMMTIPPPSIAEYRNPQQYHRRILLSAD